MKTIKIFHYGYFINMTKRHNLIMKKTLWNDLLKIEMKKIGMTQAALAEKMEVPQGTIARYLTNKRQPHMDKIAAMMKCVGLPKMVINSDGTVEPFDSNVEPVINHIPKYDKTFPVLSTVQAGLWMEAIEPYPIEEIDDWRGTTVNASDRSFWLRVVGDSMTSMSGDSIPEGAYILIDPNVEPINKDFVIAKLTDVNETTFKQYVTDSGDAYLKPLNSNYSTIKITKKIQIIGVVVDCKLNINRRF